LYCRAAAKSKNRTGRWKRDQWQLKWASASAVELVTLALPRPALGTIDHGKGKLINFCFSGWCPALEHDHKLFPRPLRAIIESGK
jgi:hypothetical protein